MKTKHTPGPWATDIIESVEIIDREGVNSGRKNDRRINGATVYVNHGSGQGSEICSLRHDPEDGLDLHDAEYQANATLIATAPELLEACKAIYDDPHTTCACADKLRAVIAKAEGREQ